MKTIIRAILSPVFLINFAGISLILTSENEGGIIILGAFAAQVVLAWITSAKSGTYTRPIQLLSDSMADSIRLMISAILTFWWYSWSLGVFPNQTRWQFYSIILLLGLSTIVTGFEAFQTLKVGCDSLYRQNPVTIQNSSNP